MPSEKVINLLDTFESAIDSDPVAATETLGELTAAYADAKVDEEILTRRAAELSGSVSEQSAGERIEALMQASVGTEMSRPAFLAHGAAALETSDEADVETLREQAAQLRARETQYHDAAAEAESAVHEADVQGMLELVSFSPVSDTVPKGSTVAVTGVLVNVGDEQISGIESTVETSDGIAVSDRSGLSSDLSGGARSDVTLTVSGNATGPQDLTIESSSDSTISRTNLSITVRDKPQYLTDAVQMIDELLSRIEGGDVHHGIANALSKKLENARRKVVSARDSARHGDEDAANRDLNPAINMIEAFREQLQSLDEGGGNGKGKANGKNGGSEKLPQTLQFTLSKQSKTLLQVLANGEQAAV
ncbi:hypothetical protein I7X12_08575 [Halosimplex litoreum]|uniref:Uncharacterized protein n=1 Tax=Halosimplex litoreum TaxID=1198301 RepID=A0A7U3WAK0_9EURY|nr:hypothetical protein [Halosimplex litoreum]QPV64645.1 hypothetical protein I7X12_08575 [Halosimplex litoreum]